MQQFGAFLSNLRSSFGLSLEELAGLVGTSRSTLSRLENGEVPRPFKGSMRRLALSIAETLCSSRQETERYLDFAGLSRSLLTETEEIRLGFLPRIASGSQGEVTSLGRLCGVYEKRLHELGAQAATVSLPHLKFKIQEYTLALEEARSRLRILSSRQDITSFQGTCSVPSLHATSMDAQTPGAQDSGDDQEYEALAAYLQQQRTTLTEALAPGTHMRVRDMIDPARFFIPPPWNLSSGAPLTDHAASAGDVVEYLIEAVCQGQRVLLLGEPGQGKTTVLKRVFTLMVDRFLRGHRTSEPIPLYIALREIANFSGDALDTLWAALKEDVPLSFEQFASLARQNRFVFLLDGFDEIRGALTQRAINERASSKVFTYPAILSCRKNFYELYLSISAIEERYPWRVELQPLTWSHALREYVLAFCRKKWEQKTAGTQHPVPPAEYIARTIEASPELRDLAQRPLLLVMMLDLFTDPEEVGEREWNAAKLYQKYTEKWLKHEAAKPDSVLKWHEKAALMQEIAWSIHASRTTNVSLHERYQNGAITQHDLLLLLERLSPRFRHIPLSQVFDDLCLRSFLIVGEGDAYSFIHKSFQEYYVGKSIFEHLRSKEQLAGAAAHVLGEFISMEVGIFLKAMLDARACSGSDRDHVVDVLIAAYRHNGGDDERSATIRENASHYLTFLGTPKAVQFLEQAYAAEPDKWVQRGIMVGLALLCQRGDMLDRYIEMISQDPEAASINIGYHLVYYGDQAPEDGYYDRGGQRCEGTLRSIFRRLKSEPYRVGWPLDLLTLRTLLEQRGAAILSVDEHYRPFLTAFLHSDYLGMNEAFLREQRRLQRLLDEVTYA